MLLICLLSPVVAAALIAALPVHASRKVAVAGCGASLAGCLLAWAGFQSSGDYEFEILRQWLPQVGISFHLGVDGISLPLATMSALIAMAGAWMSIDIRRRQRAYYVLYLLMAAGGIGAFLAVDLFLFYFLFELEVLCIYVLIAGWAKPADDATARPPAYAAMRLTVFVASGSLLVLLGIAAMYALGGGAFDITLLKSVHFTLGQQQALFGILALGFGIMLSVVPFHFWSPAGYAAAPTGVAMLSAGVFKNVGAYGLLRVGFELLPDGARAWAPVLGALGIANILFAGWVALRQRDWKLLISYASISHVGYILIGLGTFSVTGLNAAVLTMLAGGLATALMFGVLGQIETTIGSRTIGAPAGLARPLPFWGVLGVAASLAVCGQPGFANFVSEVMVFIAAWQEGSTLFRVCSVTAVWGIVLTATYMLRAVRASFYGPAPADLAIQRAPVKMDRIPALLLLLALMALGLFPRLVTDLTRVALQWVGGHG